MVIQCKTLLAGYGKWRSVVERSFHQIGSWYVEHKVYHQFRMELMSQEMDGIVTKIKYLFTDEF